MPDKDLNDMMERDRKTISDAVSSARNGPTMPHPARAIESILWILTFGAIAFMMVSLLFTGQRGPLEGELWLGLSMLGIVVPGGLALLIRLLRTGGGQAIDRAITGFLE